MTSRAFAHARRVPIGRLVDAQLYLLLAKCPNAHPTTFAFDQCRCGYSGLVHRCIVRNQSPTVRGAGPTFPEGHGQYCRRCNPHGCPTCRLIERNVREGNLDALPDPRPRTGDRMVFKRQTGSFRALRSATHARGRPSATEAE